MHKNVVKVGDVFETVFWINKERGDDAEKARFRAVRMGDRRAPKVVLCDDPRVLPGHPCRVRVRRVFLPEVEGKGFIEVEYLNPAAIRFDDDVYVDEVARRQLEILLCNGRSILLDGPQGAGKTTLARAIANALHMTFVPFNCSVCYDPTDFMAVLRLRATPSGGTETVWEPTEILTAIRSAREPGDERVLIFLDEFNRCREYARNALMSALDATRRIHDPVSNQSLEIPENVQWIAAINNGAQFSGTYRVDVAQLDRFSVLKVDYPPPDREADLLSRRYPTVAKRLVALVVKCAREVRKDENIVGDLSMRATDEACMFLSHPAYGSEANRDALLEILTTSFCNRFEGEARDPGTEAGQVREIVERVLKNF